MFDFVSIQANLDLDAAFINSQMDTPTDTSFQYAKNVYEKGAHSKVVASITLGAGLEVDLNEGDQITGKNDQGGQVVLKAYDDYPAGTTEIRAQYVTEGCYVGGLPSASQVLTGCLTANNGTLNTKDQSVSYTYNPSSNTESARTLQGFSTTAVTRMRPDQDKLPYFEEFQKFLDYYGDTDYADKYIQAAFAGESTSFTNPVQFDFSKWGGDKVALGGKTDRQTKDAPFTRAIH